MSDSFADLWNSTAPSKPATQSKPLGAQTASPQAAYGARRPAPDAFSILSSAGSPATSRPITPSTSRSPAAAAPRQMGAPRSTGSPVTGGGGDAFSSLLSGTLSTSGNPANMTMAQRQAQAESARLEALRRQSSAAGRPQAQTSSAWAGLDALAASSKPSPAPAPSASSGLDDLLGFTSSSPAPAPAKPTPPPTSPPHDDDWGLGDFGSSKPSPAPARSPPPATKSGSLWDLDDFASPSANGASRSRADTPSKDFDFGNREDHDGLLHGSGDEEDILGDLARPVDQVAKPRPRAESQDPSPPPRSRTQTASPPPHVLGQLIEMGFSITQARTALAATDTGTDVQAALEILFANGAAGGSDSRPRSREDHEDAPPPRLPRRRPDAPPRRDSSPSRRGDGILGDQASVYIAQASEVGSTLLKNASAFWKQGKQNLQKAYEEKIAQLNAGEEGSRSRPDSRQRGSGRPKWMEQAAAEGAEEPAPSSSFRDDDAHPVPPRRPQQANGKARAAEAPAEVDLFGPAPTPAAPEEPKFYQSPYRRNAPSSRSAPKPPPPSATRTLIPASASAVQTSTQHKTRGNEAVKLGQYGDAEGHYSAAISCLPEGHILLIPLYNNRALARLKTGEYKAAEADAGTVLTLVEAVGGLDARFGDGGRIQAGDGAGVVDLGEGLLKAWRRRAEALEGREQWAEAGRLWEKVSGAGWARAQDRTEAARAAGRCRQMLAPKPAPSAAPPKPKPAAPPKPRPAAPISADSARVAELRKAAEDAEAEDAARADLKDSVDARLLAWKKGKEANVRALIASLDTVLWPELGPTLKVDMKDLLTPGQVKVKYMKAIGRLHPDKLNASNTTLEQRMIANGVFGTLNEAYNAFVTSGK
ncbi:hypothetical protein EV121DRAFT_259565 [Schizophyllum commune]